MTQLQVNKIYPKVENKYSKYLKIVKITKMFVFYTNPDCTTNNIFRESIKNFTKRIIID